MIAGGPFQLNYSIVLVLPNKGQNVLLVCAERMAHRDQSGSQMGTLH